MIYLKEVREGDVNKRAGIVIVDGKSILGCLPTPSIKYPNLERKLDLPKGHMQEGETPIDAAIRECWEETNIKFESWKLKKGIVISPENCGYELVSYDKISERFFPELVYAIQASIK